MRRNRNVHGLLVLLGFVALLVPTAAMKAQGVPEDVTGSTLSAVTPATLTPGVTVNLCFTAHLVSPDFEYIDRFDVDLPDGWTIGTVAADSVPPANGCYLPPESGVDAGNVVYWQSPEDLPTWCGTWIGGSAGTDFDFCVEVTVPDCAGAPWDLPWNILGDTWGDPPHEVNGTFSSVACGASQAPNIDVAPLSLSSTQAPNTTSSQTLNVGNTGAANLVWGIAEEPAAIPVQPLSRALDRTLAPGDGFAAPASAPVSFAPAIAAAVSTGESVRAVLDDFNRPDGPIGPNWTVHNGACNVVSNAATCTGSGRATFNSATGTGDQAEMDVAVFGTDLDYQALLLNYGAGANNLFIKVQLQDHHTQFDYAACYTGNNNSGASFGLGFFALSSPFTSAHMAVSRVGDDVTISFTNIDGGAQPPQTYVCSGAPPREGTGIGIAGYAGVDRVDNFGGSGGTAVCSNPADVPWLSVSPASGTTAAGASTPVTVTFDSTGLAAGAYGANLCITSNDPDAGPGNGTDLVVVPVSLTVSGPAMHTVTASVGTPAGTIMPPSQTVAHGATATFTLTPDSGYAIDTVGGTCPAGSLAGNVYTTGPITADCEVVANFRQLTYTVTSSVGMPAGTIAPPSQTVAHGATATFTLTPDSGFEIDGVGGTCPAGSLAGNVYTTGAITADCEVVANFRPEAGPGPSVLEIPTLGPAGGALLGLLLAGLGLGALRRRRA
ncbi:MAG: hypothetical protein GX178_05685 [Acidobacteria bacterium]|nr:hypothetical protein [Acidobacteriota bacterium]